VHPSWEGCDGIAVSCEDGSGIDALSEAVYARLQSGSIGLGTNPVAINARHKRCLAAAREYLDAALVGMAQQDPPELVSVEIRAALDSIGEVLGKVDTEELLGEIFGSFCIGK
jgi:tRNA modification GTPase